VGTGAYLTASLRASIETLEAATGLVVGELPSVHFQKVALRTNQASAQDGFRARLARVGFEVALCRGK
jgi:hypothetical protein